MNSFIYTLLVSSTFAQDYFYPGYICDVFYNDADWDSNFLNPADNSKEACY